MTEAFVNFYEILQVSRKADQKEIKKAFRVLAKRFHPDANPENPEWAEGRMKQIMKAYRVLADDRRRTQHDTQLRHQARTHPEPRAESERAGAAARILRQLLDGAGARALRLYDEMRRKGDFNLFNYMTVRDYLDCIFLLAEQMERGSRHEEALDLYEELYREECEPPRQRYFFEEVRERIKNIYVRKLARKAKTPEAKLDCYRRLLTFELKKSDRAFVLKKMAESHMAAGDSEKARALLDQALELRPNIKGITKLVAQLESQ
jgi:curved DNA-binding protein CbpA